MTTSRVERRLGGDHTPEPADGDRERGDFPGNTPIPEDLRLQEVYGDWVHANPDTHLDGGIRYSEMWQGWWYDLVVMPSWHYDAPSGKVGQRFVEALVGELRGVWEIQCNSEQFMVLQTVFLQQARHVTASQAI